MDHRPSPDRDFLEALLDRPAWMEHGACRGVGNETFFTSRGQRMLVKAAKTMCATCPVIEDCLAYALDQPDLQGIWGGTSPRERVHLRVRRQVA